MTAIDNLIRHSDLVAYTSYWDTDKVIGYFSGTLSVGAASVGSVATATTTHDTGFGTSCYFVGQFSTDGGTTWNDLGIYQPNLTTPGMPVLQTTTLRAYVTSGGVLTVVALNWYDLVHGSSSSKTITYRINLLAKQNQGTITPVNITPSTFLDTFGSMTPQIFAKGTFTASTTLNTTINFTITPGFIAGGMSFFEPSANTAGIEGVVTVPAGSIMSLDWFRGSSSGISADVRLSSTSAVFTPVQSNSSTPNGIAGTQHYVLYLNT